MRIALLPPLLLLLGALLAPSARGEELFTPLRGADGRLWRGDQVHPRGLLPPLDDGRPAWIENLRWCYRPALDGKAFWTPLYVPCALDLDKVRSVTLLGSPFPPELFAAHYALLFRFDAGGMAPLLGRAPADARFAAEGLVVSVEAKFERGQSFGLSTGLTGRHAIVFCLSTYRNYRHHAVDMCGRDMEAWPLKVSRHEARAMAWICLSKALRSQGQDTYWLTRRSCTTEAVDSIVAGLALAKEGRRASKEDILADAFSRPYPDERSDLRRVYAGGLLVNPVMSIPSLLPWALERRAYLENPPEIVSRDDEGLWESLEADRRALAEPLPHWTDLSAR